MKNQFFNIKIFYLILLLVILIIGFSIFYKSNKKDSEENFIPEITIKKSELSLEKINEKGWHYIGKMNSPRVDSLSVALPDGKILFAWGMGRSYIDYLMISSIGPYVHDTKELSQFEIFDPKKMEFIGYYYKNLIDINSRIIAEGCCWANISDVNKDEVVFKTEHFNCSLDRLITFNQHNAQINVKKFAEDNDVSCNIDKKERNYYFSKYMISNTKDYIIDGFNHKIYITPNEKLPSNPNILPFDENKIIFAGGMNKKTEKIINKDTTQEGKSYKTSDDVWIYTY